MKNKITKKFLGIALSACIIMQLCSCGNSGNTNVQNVVVQTQENTGAEEQTSVSNTSDLNEVEGEETTAEESKEIIGAVPYAYEQELNVIDDNYRNYYEIFVYSFYDSDGDGIGDLNGVIQKLDYVQEMGFNGIWMMPIMQSPSYHKYDVANYYSIDKEYGTLEDFQKLVDECHNRGIRVVIDFVINHSSTENAWFQEACTYLKALPEGQEPDSSECPYVDYYHFAREQVSNSYYSVEGSDWYYEGEFSPKMPDLNLANPRLRTELEDIALFWIDMGVDGFRMDAALHFEEGDTTFNTEVLNWLYSFCTGLNPNFYMVSEVWASRATIASYYASETPSMFNFELADVQGKLIKAARGSYAAADFVGSMAGYHDSFAEYYEDYIDAPFIANHDMSRVANILVQDANNMKMACGLLMTMNGSPFVYYGEEIGMSSSGSKDENKRLPMIWSDTDTTGMANGPVDADKDIESAFAGVEEQLKDPYSILNYYKRAVRLRNENPELARGQIEIIESLTEGNQAAIIKRFEDSSIGVIYNTSDELKDIQLADTELAAMSIRGYLTLNGEEVLLENGTLSMPAKSICILK